MKTKEFIKRIEQLGYLVNEGYADWQISRISKGQDLLVAIVNKNNLSRISTDFVGWWDIADEDKSKLLDIIVEFAKTPIEDREEEKKFLIKHKYLVSKDIYPVNLARNKEKNVYRVINCKADNLVYQVQFTLKEIEEIGEKLNTDLFDFELVEVEE